MIKKIAVLAFIGFNFWSFAQENVVVVDRRRGRREPRIVDNTYVVKFTPTQIVMGEFNVGLEYVVNDMSSLELEIGPTFSNIGFQVTDSHTDPWGGMGNVSNTTRAGFFMGLGYRFYPMDNARVLNHLYISPVMKFRIFNYGLEDHSGTLAPTKGNENQFLFTFNVGRQWWFSEHFSMDLYGGLGFAYEVHNDKYMEAIYNPDTDNYDYQWTENRFNGVRIAATLGLKFGIGY